MKSKMMMKGYIASTWKPLLHTDKVIQLQRRSIQLPLLVYKSEIKARKNYYSVTLSPPPVRKKEKPFPRGFYLFLFLFLALSIKEKPARRKEIKRIEAASLEKPRIFFLSSVLTPGRVYTSMKKPKTNCQRARAGKKRNARERLISGMLRGNSRPNSRKHSRTARAPFSRFLIADCAAARCCWFFFSSSSRLAFFFFSTQSILVISRACIYMREKKRRVGTGVEATERECERENEDEDRGIKLGGGAERQMESARAAWRVGLIYN